MDKKRGLLIAFLLVFVFFIPYSEGYSGDLLKCKNGASYYPNIFNNLDCIISETQTIDVKESSDSQITWRFSSIKFENEAVLTFINTQAPVDYITNGYSGSSGSNSVSGGSGGTAYSIEPTAGNGGKGGSSGDRGGSGGGGGAGGRMFYKGGAGGNGGVPDGCGQSDKAAKGAQSPYYAGANIKFKASKSFEMISGSIISKGYNGNNGGQSSDGTNGCLGRKYGGSGASGGSGGGRVVIEADTVSFGLMTSFIDVSGGKGGIGGKGDSGGGNDEGGSGGGGGGGAGGIIEIYHYSYKAPGLMFEPTPIVLGGNFGNAGTGGNVGQPGIKGDDGIYSKPTDKLETAVNDIFNCSDKNDNDEDGLRDMNDPDCFCNKVALITGCLREGICESPILINAQDFYSISKEDASSNNSKDGCCGDDISRCMSNDPDLLCSGFLTKQKCDTMLPWCIWKDSSDFGSLGLDVNKDSIRCISDGTNWKQERAHSLKLGELRNFGLGSWKVSQIVEVNSSKENVWFTCDSKEGHLSSNKNDNNLILQDSNKMAASNFMIPQKYMCITFNEASGENHSTSQFLTCMDAATPKGFNESGNRSIGDSAYSILKGKLTQENKIVVNSPSVYELGKYTTMEFDTNYTLSKVLIDLEGNTDFSYESPNLLPTTQRADGKIKHYIINISLVPDTKVIRIEFTPSDSSAKSFFVGNIILHNATSKGNGNKFFCSKESSGAHIWITDLDSSNGKAACNAIKSFGWTGSSCCGDDTTSDKKEHYLGTESACYNGMFVRNDSLLYNTTGSKVDTKVLYFAKGNVKNFTSCGEFTFTKPSYSIIENNQPVVTDSIIPSLEKGKACEYIGSYVCLINKTGSSIWVRSDDKLFLPALNGKTVERFNVSQSLKGDSYCCPNNGCFNGTGCMKAGEFIKDDQNNAKICSKGEWVDAKGVRSYNPDMSEYNFCEDRTMCFISEDEVPETLNLDGDTKSEFSIRPSNDKFKDGDILNTDECLHTTIGAEINGTGCSKSEISNHIEEHIVLKKDNTAAGYSSGYCVPQKYFVKDAICINGNWNSRTAFVAAAMLNYTKTYNINNYSIFCDRPELSLNDKTGYSDVNTNNYCVLNYFSPNPNIKDTRRITGTSINGGYVSLGGYLFDVQGIQKRDMCDNIKSKNENNYFKCESDKASDTAVNVYYNPYLHTVIITKFDLDGEISNLQAKDWFGSFTKLISDPINYIIGLINGGERNTNPSFGGDYAMEKAYSRLYFAKLENKMAKGFVREYQDKNDEGYIWADNYIYVEYNNTNTDICREVLRYRFGPPANPAKSNILCEAAESGNSWSFRVVSPKDTDSFNSAEKTVWPDLTSETRLTGASSTKPSILMISQNETAIFGEDVKFTATLTGYTGTYVWKALREGGSEISSYSSKAASCTTKDCVIKFTEDIQTVYISVTAGQISVTKLVTMHKKPFISQGKVAIIPSSPSAGQPLTASYKYADDDNDQEFGTKFEWYNSTDKKTKIGSLQTLPIADVKVDKTYVVCVTPCDLYSCGDKVCSSGISISAKCGNGIREGTEKCDGSDLNSKNCSTQGFFRGNLGCYDNCTFDTRGCSTCGNGNIEGTEDCDGSSSRLSNSFECKKYDSKYLGGTLKCDSYCKFITSSCVFCGDDIVNETLEEECDGNPIDNTEAIPTCQIVMGPGDWDGMPSCTTDCSLDKGTCVLKIKYCTNIIDPTSCMKVLDDTLCTTAADLGAGCQFDGYSKCFGELDCTKIPVGMCDTDFAEYCKLV